jgi:hypothetical protein
MVLFPDPFGPANTRNLGTITSRFLVDTTHCDHLTYFDFAARLGLGYNGLAAIK